MKILTRGEHYNKKEKNMIELSKFSKACKEVLEILNNVEEKDLFMNLFQFIKIQKLIA